MNAELQSPGPWEACERSGYATSYWSIKRRNPAWMGGTEYATNKSGNPLRFGSKATADRAAAERYTP
ncbi:MAG: hypothetical protein V4730_11995 [Pseudomonadota bacterium]